MYHRFIALVFWGLLGSAVMLVIRAILWGLLVSDNWALNSASTK